MTQLKLLVIMASRALMMALLLAAVAVGCARAQLQEKFYSETCPSVEEVVRKEMVRALSVAPSLAGPLLRMHFHDCFVRVSNVHSPSNVQWPAVYVQWPENCE